VSADARRSAILHLPFALDGLIRSRVRGDGGEEFARKCIHEIQECLEKIIGPEPSMLIDAALRQACFVEGHYPNPLDHSVGGCAICEALAAEANPADLGEALDLLALWYGRWQGFVAGTPDDMHLRTRDLLERTGRPPRKIEVQR
jgi:hypothetical protein